MTSEQIEEAYIKFRKDWEDEHHGGLIGALIPRPDIFHAGIKAGVEFAEQCHSLTEEEWVGCGNCGGKGCDPADDNKECDECFGFGSVKQNVTERDEMSKQVWKEVVGLREPEIIELLIRARLAQRSPMTEARATELVKPYQTWTSAINYSFMPCEDAVRLLIAHSNPSPVLEERWTTVKPDFPCLLLTRTKWKNEPYRYNFYILEMVDGEDSNNPSYYLGWLDADGEELGDLKGDLSADEYLVIERTELSKGKGK